MHESGKKTRTEGGRKVVNFWGGGKGDDTSRGVLRSAHTVACWFVRGSREKFRGKALSTTVTIRRYSHSRKTLGGKELTIAISSPLRSGKKKKHGRSIPKGENNCIK